MTLSLFVQLSFRSVTSTVELKREQVRRILQVAPSQEQHVRDLEAALATYLRKATDTFDLSRNVEVSEAQSAKLFCRFFVFCRLFSQTDLKSFIFCFLALVFLKYLFCDGLYLLLYSSS